MATLTERIQANRNEAAELLIRRIRNDSTDDVDWRLVDKALYIERREMILRIERALFARGWTLDQEDGPQADVRAILDEEAAR